MSSNVRPSACPTWSLPVTLGGGITMQYGGFPELGSAVKYPRTTHASAHLGSTSAGSYRVVISAPVWGRADMRRVYETRRGRARRAHPL